LGLLFGLKWFCFDVCLFFLDKMDKAELATKGMAAKLQAALDAEADARRREAKVKKKTKNSWAFCLLTMFGAGQATEECRKQEELALKQKGQLADLSRQLESSSSEGTARSGAGAKAEEASEKQVRAIKDAMLLSFVEGVFSSISSNILSFFLRGFDRFARLRV